MKALIKIEGQPDCVFETQRGIFHILRFLYLRHREIVRRSLFKTPHKNPWNKIIKLGG